MLAGITDSQGQEEELTFIFCRIHTAHYNYYHYIFRSIFNITVIFNIVIIVLYFKPPHALYQETGIP